MTWHSELYGCNALIIPAVFVVFVVVVAIMPTRILNMNESTIIVMTTLLLNGWLFLFVHHHHHHWFFFFGLYVCSSWWPDWSFCQICRFFPFFWLIDKSDRIDSIILQMVLLVVVVVVVVWFRKVFFCSFIIDDSENWIKLSSIFLYTDCE